MNRRTFLLSLSALGAGGMVAAEVSNKAGTPAKEGALPPPTPQDDLLAFAPYAQLIGSGKVNIRWRTKRPATGYVYWTQNPYAKRDKWQKAWREEDGMVMVNETFHNVTLENLLPDQPLRFEVVSEPIAYFGSYRGKCEAAVGFGETTLRRAVDEKGAVNAVVFNDLHGHIEHLPKLLALPAVQAAKPSIALFNGDCADDCGSQEGLEQRILKTFPGITREGMSILYLRGNHEYRGAMARRIRKNISPLANGHYYGAFTIGSVRFICLDSGEDNADQAGAYAGLIVSDAYVRRQGEWLAREIASPDYKAARWHVVFLHIPPFCGGIGDADAAYAPTRVRRTFDDIFAKANLTAVIAGHTHAFSLHPADKTGRGYPIMIGGGWGAKSVTAMVMRADANRFAITAYDIAGKVLGEIVRG